jgi:hypothetical protein
MTAALVHLTGSARRSPWRSFGALLAVVLPVPVLAALGLSLPLPATVERIAAKLVPFGSADAFETSASRLATGGTIVLAPGERRAGDGSKAAAVSLPEGPVGTIGASPDKTRAGLPGNTIESTVSLPDTGTAATTSPKQSDTSPAPANAEAAPSETAPSKEAGGSGGGGSAGGGPGGGGSGGSGSDPGTTPGVTDTVTGTASGAVQTATEAAGSAANTVTNATSSAADTAQGAAGALLPP